jgi:hypothetical protein
MRIDSRTRQLPEQNRIPEQKHRSNCEKGRTLMTSTFLNAPRGSILGDKVDLGTIYDPLNLDSKLGVKMYLKDFFISLSWVPYET